MNGNPRNLKEALRLMSALGKAVYALGHKVESNYWQHRTAKWDFEFAKLFTPTILVTGAKFERVELEPERRGLAVCLFGQSGMTRKLRQRFAHFHDHKVMFNSDTARVMPAGVKAG